jgi:predicted DNA-binding protein (UPF0278 family)
MQYKKINEHRKFDEPLTDKIDFRVTENQMKQIRQIIKETNEYISVSHFVWSCVYREVRKYYEQKSLNR